MIKTGKELSHWHYLNLILHMEMLDRRITRHKKPRELYETISILFIHYGLSEDGLGRGARLGFAMLWLNEGSVDRSKAETLYALVVENRDKLTTKHISHITKLRDRDKIAYLIDDIRKSSSIYDYQVSLRLTTSKGFYNSPEWKKIRYYAFENNGNFCCCCGRSPQDGAVLHVDHILPRSLYPELALNKYNVQILCSLCNMAKSNKSSLAFGDDFTDKLLDTFGEDHSREITIPEEAV